MGAGAVAVPGASFSALVPRLWAGLGDDDVDAVGASSVVEAVPLARSSTVEARRSLPFRGEAPTGGKYSSVVGGAPGAGAPASERAPLGKACVVGVLSAAELP